jgi:hypothetical protein
VSTCSEDRETCVSSHFCETLDGRREGVGWRMRCPVCTTRRALSVQVNGAVIVWNCHHKPACDREAIRNALAALLPCVTPARVKKLSVDREELIRLADCDLPKTALRIAIFQLAGISPQEVRRRLKLSESTYYESMKHLALRKSGENRRSG